VASSTVAGNAAGGASAAAAAKNDAANNAVVAVPLIVEGVIAAGARAAHACVTSPACMNMVKLAGTTAVAKVVAIASESNEAGAPGYEAAQAPVNHTGNQSAAPNYAGTGTTTPNNGPATGSTTTTPAQQPGAGSNLVFNDGKLSDRPSQIADSFGVPTRDVRTAIENIKQDNLPRGGPIRNPDVYVDLSTGEVYPQLPGGLRGDSIGNLHDYLPRR